MKYLKKIFDKVFPVRNVWGPFIFKIKRGYDEQRKDVVLKEGEVAFTIDKREVWIGDGVTPGGCKLGKIPNHIEKDPHGIGYYDA